MKIGLPIIVAFVAGLFTYACIFSPTQHFLKAADTPPKEVYKVYDWTEATKAGKSNEKIEEEINKLAEDGWKVRTGVAYRLILAK